MTGAAGAVGSYLLESLAEDPKFELYGVVRSVSQAKTDPLRALSGKVSWLLADLSRDNVVEHLIGDVKADVCFHFASWARPRESFDRPAAYVQNNVFSTLNILEGIRKRSPWTTFLLASTPEVCSNTAPIIDEFSPVAPTNPYGASKAACESLTRAYSHSFGVKTLIVRTGSYINPRRKDLAISSFAGQIAACEAGLASVVRHGNLKSVRNWLDVKDVIRGYRILADKGVAGETYCMGGSEVSSVGDLLQRLLARSTKKGIRLVPDPPLSRPVDVEQQIVHSKKLEALDWRPTVQLDDSLMWLMTSARKDFE